MLCDIKEEWSCWVGGVTQPQLSHGIQQAFLTILIHTHTPASSQRQSAGVPFDPFLFSLMWVFQVCRDSSSCSVLEQVGSLVLGANVRGGLKSKPL